MAVEIKELIIRAVVEYPQSSPSGETGSSAGDSGQSARLESQSELIQACVKQVLKILKKQEKR